VQRLQTGGRAHRPRRREADDGGRARDVDGVCAPVARSGAVDDLRACMRDHEWSSLSEMRGNMSLRKVADLEACERANYMLLLQDWRA
jgi:hypothetical protein